MFLTLKKYDIITCFLAVFLMAVTYSFVIKGTESVMTSSTPVSGKVIVVDAGHGYPDGGAVGESGVPEKDINLSVAFKLQELLEKNGAYVLLTRADDNAVVDDLNRKIRDIKRSDLNFRRDFKNSSNCDAFISIHMNKFPQSKYSGAQVFYASEPKESRVLGEKMMSRLKEISYTENNRAAKVADESIFILKDSIVPSVIVECGFLSNHDEEKLLLTDEYQDKLAFAIYCGLMDYMNK